jgi:hypothetical protein
LILWSLTRRVVDRQNEHAFAAPIVQRMLFAGCRSGLPTVFGYREHVVEGGQISYGIDLRWCYRRTTYFAGKILRDAALGDLPIEFPTKLVARVTRTEGTVSSA